MYSMIKKLTIVLFAGILVMYASGCLYMMNPSVGRSLISGESPFGELKNTTQTLKRPINVVPLHTDLPDTVAFYTLRGLSSEDIANCPKTLPEGILIRFGNSSFHVTKDYRLFFIPWSTRYSASFYIEGHSLVKSKMEHVYIFMKVAT